MELLPKTLTGPIGRIGAAAQNALEVARFGGLATDELPSPYEVMVEHPIYRLRRYYSEADAESSSGNGAENALAPASLRPAVLMVPPLMLAAEIYDVSPATSAV